VPKTDRAANAVPEEPAVKAHVVVGLEFALQQPETSTGALGRPLPRVVTARPSEA
jgi:hypothetical protein